MENFNFVIKGKTYETQPVKVGNVIDLWRLRAALSGGTYGQLYRMILDNADEALIAIDMEAFFSVFCPKFIEDLKPGSFRELGLDDYLEVKEVFIDQIQPWMTKIEGLLKKKKENE